MMHNKPSKQPWKFLSKAKNAFAVGSLFAALIAADPSSAQTIAQKNDFPAGQTTAFNDKDPTAIDKTTTVNIVPNALTFATTNVDKYFPDMKEHLVTMMNSFRDQEHKDSTLALLNKMTANIDDPEQKTGAVISALEWTVFNKWLFMNKYDNKITDKTFGHIEIFNAEYKVRFKKYYAKLETYVDNLKKENTQKEKELEQGLNQIEAIMNKFSPNDVKNNEQTKNLVIKTQKLFINSDYEFSNHTQTLFDALK